MPSNDYAKKKDFREFYQKDSKGSRKGSAPLKSAEPAEGRRVGGYPGKPFQSANAPRPIDKQDRYQGGTRQGKAQGTRKGGFDARPQYNSDPGYEDRPAGNMQRGRGIGRTPANQPGNKRQTPAGRFDKQSDRKAMTGFESSPAAQRFGPSSSPVRKPFGKLAPRQYPVPARMVETRQEQPQTPNKNDQFEDDLPQVNLLTGRNPIREAIKTGRDLEKLMIAKGELSGSAREIVSLAKKSGVMIQSVERSRLDQLAKNHQGMIAFASAYQYSTVEEILEVAKQRGEDPFIIVLDQITDPHNLGAVIRTAVCAGAHGVVVPMHRAVGLTPAAVKASAGAVEHIKVARVTNLNQTIKTLQKQGIWFYAAQTEGEDYRSAKLSGPCALVIGSEGEGVSQLTASICDKQIFIPMQGEISSLNASVAAGILMYAVFSTRNPKA